jgi:hypothetical protein
VGRKSTYTQKIADLICERLAAGESLRAICRDDGMPTEAAVRLWARDDVQGFASQYAHARALGYERLAEELLEIADDGSSDTHQDADGNERTNAEVVARSRLRVDTRKWLLSKMLPKVYGERSTHEHVGENGGGIRLLIGPTAAAYERKPGDGAS